MLYQLPSNERFARLAKGVSELLFAPKTSEKKHGAKQWKPSDTVVDLNIIVEEEGEDGEKLKEELSACHHFLLDTEMENWRHKVFNFQISKLDNNFINEKIEEVFNELDPAAKIKVVLRFVLRNVKTGEYRENIGTQKQYFVRKIAFTVYESGFDYNSGKIRKN